MFNSKKSILYIAKNTLAAVFIENKTELVQFKQLQWNDHTLDAALKDIKKEYGKRVRLLLGEDLVYVVSLIIPKSTAINRETVQTLAQEYIPEDLNKTSWDFTELLQTIDAQNVPIVIIQVAAVVQSFFQLITQEIQSVGLEFEAVEPLSYALAYQIRNKVDPVIVLYKTPEKSTVLAMVHRGLILQSEVLQKPLTVKYLQSILNKIQSDYNLIPKILLQIGTTAEEIPADIATLDIKVETSDINPFVGIAMMEELRGKDERVMNVELNGYKQLKKTKPVIQEPVVTAHSEPPAQPVPISSLPPQTPTAVVSVPPQQTLSTPPQPALKEQLIPKQSSQSILKQIGLLIGITLLLVGIGIGGWYVYTIYSKMASVSPTTSKNNVSPVANTPTARPTSKLVDKKTYEIAVHNGTTITGRAKEIGDFLEEEGYTVTDRITAEKQDYTVTEIQAANTIEESFLTDLKTALEQQFEEVTIQTASASAKNIVVIIGDNAK